jgi:hypothetical protein
MSRAALPVPSRRLPEFLQESRDRFDMTFCSGIFYHTENPFELIKAILRHTGRVFLWTRPC